LITFPPLAAVGNVCKNVCKKPCLPLQITTVHLVLAIPANRRKTIFTRKATKGKMKTKLILACLLSFNIAAMAQGLVTLTVKGTGSSNEVTIAENQQITLKTWIDGDGSSSSGDSRIVIWKDGTSFEIYPDMVRAPSSPKYIPTPIIVTGPARIVLHCWGTASSKGLATFDVTPGSYPPDKAVTIGAYSGNLKVTMETSKNLVDWIAAENGAFYTNSPDARFFRITIDKNAPGGP